MAKHTIFCLGLILCGYLTGAANLFAQSPSSDEALTTVTEDGITIYGEPYFDTLGEETPLVLLFHQARSNGRGEYEEIAGWLNQNGYRAIAWDQRAGGDIFGSSNRTMDRMPEDTAAEYCDAYADLKAAVDYVVEQNLADRVVVWGSSYSAGLVFKLAAEYKDRVSAVLAFSPASGNVMDGCRARDWLHEVEAPVFALRPASEMERESSLEQRELLEMGGADVLVVEHGVHGSSMLVDTRTDHDMSAARQAVLDWLNAQ